MGLCLEERRRSEKMGHLKERAQWSVKEGCVGETGTHPACAAEEDSDQVCRVELLGGLGPTSAVGPSVGLFSAEFEL